jgi:translation initiation factor IF-2
MSTITIRDFAKQIGIEPERLVKQLNDAGVAGKTVEDTLEDAEKRQLLGFLRGEEPAKAAEAPVASRGKITLKKKTTSELQQTTKTGIARTVQVQTKKRRTFVKREALEEQQKQEQEAARLEAEEASRQEQQQREAEEAAKLEQQRTEEEQQRQAELEAERIRAEQELQEKEQQALAEKEEKERQEKEQQEAQVQPEKTATTEDAAEPVESAPTAPAEPPKPRREVAMPSIISKRDSSVKRRSPIVREADPEEQAKLAEQAKTQNNDNKGGRADDRRKNKGRRGSSVGREELHVAKGKKGRKQAVRRPSQIKSSVSDQHVFEKPVAPVVREVQIPENISVSELAAQMSVKAGEVVKVLFNMGTMVTINQTLDQDTAMLVVEEMGHTAVEAKQDDPEAFLAQTQEVEFDDSEKESRCPVVTVMGHVDHGKTSLLDYIRKAKVASGEAGGITQHIGAYQVETNNGEVTFLDTPGHEAFSAMRARGAQATDLIILVVAADDGVKPQTIEAIKHARSAEVPIVVAINKIDKDAADPDRVKQELATEEVIPEDWGGDVMMIPVSAHTGQGVDELLDSVAIQSELLELKARPTGNAKGIVVEARLDKGRGPVCTILVQEGILNYGDIVLVGKETGRIRAMNDDGGKSIKTAGPSTPVEIQGLTGVPAAGDEVMVVDDERKAREAAEFRQTKQREVRLARQQAAKLENMFAQMSEGEVKNVNVLIKGDVQGSIEALTESLLKLSTDEVKVSVVHGMVGAINESDINLAMASSAVVIGFNVRADAQARKLAEQEDVQIRYYSIIYEVIDDVKSAMEGMLEPDIKEEVLGYVEVREVFKAPKIGTIAGCYVTEGMVKRNAHVRVLRESVVIFEGTIDSLRRFKDDVSEVKSGMECGIGVTNYNDIKIEDQLEIFEKIEVKVTL